MEQNKRELIMESAMRQVAEHGMENFSLAKTAALAGVTERLIYFHFGSRDALLDECYRSFRKQAAGLYDDQLKTRLPEGPDAVDRPALARCIWSAYYRFLVEQGYRTLFVYAYRNSLDYGALLFSMREEYLAPLREMMGRINAEGLPQQGDKMLMDTLMMDLTTTAAIRVIRGEMENSPATEELIWKTVSRGAFGAYQYLADRARKQGGGEKENGGMQP